MLGPHSNTEETKGCGICITFDYYYSFILTKCYKHDRLIYFVGDVDEARQTGKNGRINSYVVQFDFAVESCPSGGSVGVEWECIYIFYWNTYLNPLFPRIGVLCKYIPIE